MNLTAPVSPFLRTVLRRTVVSFLALSSSIGFSQQHWHSFETSLPATVPPVVFEAPDDKLDPKSTNHNDPNVAVVEFNEKGELWGCVAQRCQEEYAVDFIHKARQATKTDEQLVVLTFVHGWTHNAAWQDQNFIHLRQAVDCLNWGAKEYRRVYRDFLAQDHKKDVYDLKCLGVAAHDKMRFVGVYVGWQGTPDNQSTGLGTLLDVFKTAATTAQSDAVMNLFRKLGDAAKDGQDAPAKLIIAGHSMGGYITEKVATRLLSSPPVDLAHPPCDNGRNGRQLPIDLFVLINPANNTSSGLDLMQRMQTSQPCFNPNISNELVSPLLISIHSDTDIWTGKVGSYGAHLMRGLSSVGFIKSVPFEKITPALVPTGSDAAGNKDDRSETPPSEVRLNGRTLNQSPYLMNLCYEGTWSMRLDGQKSRTSDVICDRVAEKVKEAKLALPPLAGYNLLQANGVDKGAYQALQEICDDTKPAAEHKGCTPDLLAEQNKERDALNGALHDVLAFPSANLNGPPNVLFNLYTRWDPGCRQNKDHDPKDATLPVCQWKDRGYIPGRISPARVPPGRVPNPPFNQTPYWAFDVPDSVIHGHSAFWSDEFTSLLLGFAENIR